MFIEVNTNRGFSRKPLGGIMYHNLITGRKPASQIQEGDLLTVKLGSWSQRLTSGARLLQECTATLWSVKLVGLGVPKPYQVGDQVFIPVQDVVDWE